MSHDELCEKMEADFPPIKSFLETWGAHCGAPRTVFREHVFAMLREIDAMSANVESGEVLVPRGNNCLATRAVRGGTNEPSEYSWCTRCGKLLLDNEPCAMLAAEGKDAGAKK